MHAFGKSLSQAVGQGFEHDGAVVVVVVHEVFFFGVHAHTGRHREQAHVVLQPAGLALGMVQRCDKVRQATVGVLHTVMHRLFGLLAQAVPSERSLAAALVGPQHDVVAHAVGGVQTDDCMGLQPAAFDEALQHALAVAEHTLCFCAHHLVFQNGREGASQIPGLEERAPVDEGLQLGQIKVFEDPLADELR